MRPPIEEWLLYTYHLWDPESVASLEERFDAVCDYALELEAKVRRLEGALEEILELHRYGGGPYGIRKIIEQALKEESHA